MNRPLRVKETYADIAEKNKSAKHTAVTDGTGVKSVFLITITLIVSKKNCYCCRSTIKREKCISYYWTSREKKKAFHGTIEVLFLCNLLCKTILYSKVKAAEVYWKYIREFCENQEEMFTNFMKIKRNCSTKLKWTANCDLWSVNLNPAGFNDMQSNLINKPAEPIFLVSSSDISRMFH